MADRRVRVILELVTGGFGKGMSDSAKRADYLAGRIQKITPEVHTLSRSLGVFGAAALGVAGLAVKAFADFDKAMSGVKSTGRDAARSIGALTDAALEAGAATRYSASEAAAGIEELMRAGVSAEDVLSGGLAGALDMAAAGEIEVADAAFYTASAMNQFGLDGKDASRIADVLAAAAGKANGEISDFGQALKYVGPTANRLGVSLEETNAALAVLAQNGILADSAGTALRSMLSSLTSPTDQAAAAMEQYNIELYGADGKFQGLSSLAGQLKTAFSGVDDATREAALGAMFTANGVNAATMLMGAGAEEVKAWEEAVSEAGYAGVVAATKMDNLAGDLERLKGSLETTFIKSGSGVNSAIRRMVQGLEGFVNLVGKIPAPVLSGVTALAGLEGAAMLGAGGLMRLTTNLAEAREAMNKLREVSPKVAGLLDGLKGGLGALAVGSVAVSVWQGISAAIEDAREAARPDAASVSAELVRIVNAAAGADDKIAHITNALRGAEIGNEVIGLNFDDPETIKSYDDAFAKLKRYKDYQARLETPGTPVVGSASNVYQEEGKASTRFFKEQDQRLKEFVEGGRADAARDLMASVVQIASGHGFDDEFLKTLLPEYLAADEEALAAAKIEAEDLAQAQLQLGKDTGYAVEMTEEQAAALESWRGSVAAAYQSFVDIQGANSAAIGEVVASMTDEERALLTNTNSWKELGLTAEQAMEKILEQMRRQAEDRANWEANIDKIAERINTLPRSMKESASLMLQDLTLLGEQGAETVGAIAGATEEQFKELVSLSEEDGVEAATGFATGFEGLMLELQAGANTTRATEDVDQWIRITENGKQALIPVRAAPVEDDSVLENFLWSIGKRVATVPYYLRRPVAGGHFAAGGIVGGFPSGGLLPGRPPLDRYRDNLLAALDGPDSGKYVTVQSGEFVSNLGSTGRNLAALEAGNRGATLTALFDQFTVNPAVTVEAPSVNVTVVAPPAPGPAEAVLSDRSVADLASMVAGAAATVADGVVAQARRSAAATRATRGPVW
jgi:TP901 family phage tail tape measure protein